MSTENACFSQKNEIFMWVENLTVKACVYADPGTEAGVTAKTKSTSQREVLYRGIDEA
ncbi:hypothetical protein [Fibrobacter succinogenes]|uniref:hypothetical protein n=1 Tax=Fibrobacter succinogenes TaxID=833 RepID=UPI0015E81E5C|nr:hypothetical protein [Fibrobacter succinogenes]